MRREGQEMSRSGTLRRPMRPKTARQLEWGAIGVALIGLGLMVQPITHLLFRAGFWLLFVGGIGYVSTTFWRPGDVTWPNAARTLLWVVIVVLAVVGISAAIASALL